MSENTSTEIKCTDCGKTATVPFKPTAGKPVYCKECLPKHRTPRRDSGPGNRMDTKPPKQATEENAWARRRENWHK